MILVACLYPDFYKLTHRYLDLFISEVKSQQQKMALDGDFWNIKRTSVDWTLWNEVTCEVETKREDLLISDMLSTQCDDIEVTMEEKDRNVHDEPSEEKLDVITEMDEQKRPEKQLGLLLRMYFMDGIPIVNDTLSHLFQLAKEMDTITLATYKVANLVQLSKTRDEIQRAVGQI
ncbi:hypothetical protein RFI_34836 [Reticulomyxa filosa]|uniref:Uncharacterized protein n=1 Tax=Reticulomyxa filosa TaxID=46433 RepID=X6LPC2_RETFI|nr:hypothetical protein RFI_34836 [Reticulomyxa filosa]|eukprot:ETO02585.1 hypothetical protein RFI_34836 [Reticulomyxa filosa]